MVHFSAAGRAEGPKGRGSESGAAIEPWDGRPGSARGRLLGRVVTSASHPAGSRASSFGPESFPSPRRLGRAELFPSPFRVSRTRKRSPAGSERARAPGRARLGRAPRRGRAGAGPSSRRARPGPGAQGQAPRTHTTHTHLRRRAPPGARVSRPWPAGSEAQRAGSLAGALSTYDVTYPQLWRC